MFALDASDIRYINHQRSKWDLRSEEFISREVLERSDGRLKKVNHISVFLVVFSIASNVESRGTCSMLGKLRIIG
jgi:hypothetical protein